MGLHHSEDTHTNLLARIPETTGRQLEQWFTCLKDGPSLARFEERVNWLRSEFSLPHGYATAIVHEFDKRRRRVQPDTGDKAARDAEPAVATKAADR